MACNLSVGASQLQQTIRGRIVDTQTQAPLIGANIQVTTMEPVRGASTDLEGWFKIPGVSIGRHDLKINYIGYEELLLSNVLVTSGKELNLQLSMEQKLLTGMEVVVEANRKHEPINQMGGSSVRGFTVEETGRYAGSRADPARMASNYAGVVGGGDMRNDIIVRGNSPYGVLWRLDGMDIPNPNHFNFVGTTGGLFSMLNNNLLDDSDFMLGAFPAEYGNKTAAVFDLRMRKGNPEKSEFLAQVGLNGLEFGAEGGFREGGHSSYLINYRAFNFEPLEYLGIDFKASGIPRFKDLSSKINIQTKHLGEISLFGIGGWSQLALLNSERESGDWDAANSDDITFGSDVGFVGMTHKYLFNKKLMGNFGVLRSLNHVFIDREWVYTDAAPKLKESLDMEEQRSTIKYELSYKLNSRHYFKTGLNQSRMSYRLYQEEFDDRDSLYYIFFDEEGTGSLNQGFLSWQLKMTESLTLNSGIHAQSLSLSERSAGFEPRLSLIWEMDALSKLSLGYGDHSQHQPLIFYHRSFPRSDGSMVKANQDLDFSRSRHFILGYERLLRDDLQLKIEAYNQDLFSLPVSHKQGHFSIVNQGSEFSFEVPDSLVNEGTGQNYGVEFTLEKLFTKNHYYLITGSLSRSSYTGLDGIERSTVNDVGYVVNALAGYEYWFSGDKKRAVLFDVKASRAGGKRYIPIDLAASIAQGSEVLDYSNAYGEKFKDFSKIDLKVSYRRNKPRSTHFAFIAIDNVLNTQNVLLFNYEADTQDIVTTYQLGLFPYLGYRIQF